VWRGLGFPLHRDERRDWRDFTNLLPGFAGGGASDKCADDSALLRGHVKRAAGLRAPPRALRVVLAAVPSDSQAEGEAIAGDVVPALQAYPAWRGRAGAGAGAGAGAAQRPETRKRGCAGVVCWGVKSLEV